MHPTRRALIAAPALFLRPASAAAGLRLEPVGDGVTAITGPAIRHPLLLASSRVRWAPSLPVGGESLAAAVFLLSEAGATLQLIALVAPAGDRIALLALEPLAWHGADGARLGTTLAGVGDRSRLRLARDSALPRGPTRWERETWTDYLAWQPPAGLRDAPVRPPLPGTRQHALAALRARAAALVAAEPSALTAERLAAAGLHAATFSLSVSAQPSIRQAPSAPRTIV